MALSSTRRRLLGAAAGLVGVIAAGEAALWLGAAACSRVTLDVGPATGAYVSGFGPSVEFPPVTARWLLGARGEYALPLDVGPGRGVLALHLARVTPGDLPVSITLAGGRAAWFVLHPVRGDRDRARLGLAPNDPFAEMHHLRLAIASGGGPLRLAWHTGGAGGEQRVLALDWVRVEGLPVRIPARAYGPRLLLGGVVVLALACGLSRRAAFALGLALAAMEGLAAAVDPFALVHVTSKLALPALALASLAALGLRRRPAGAAAVMLFLAGYLLHGAALFHPALHAPDMLTHNRYAAAFREASGTLAERGRAAQVAAGIAYPRIVAGRAHVFPYSPLFYAPFTWLPSERVVGAMKHVALAAGAAEVLLVFALAGAAFGARVAPLAALVAVFLPALTSRLLLAMWPTIVGHFFDLLLLGALGFLLLRPHARARWLLAGGAALLTLGAYVSSLFHVAALLLALACVERRLAPRLLALAALTLAAAVAVLYAPFVSVFVHAIVPALASSPWAGAGELDELAPAFVRVTGFYGPLLPLLAAGGLLVARRRAARPAWTLLTAYALAFLALLALRGLGGPLFKDLKEILFAGPLMALSSALALDTLARRGAWQRCAAWALVASIVVFGLARSFIDLLPRLALAAPS